MGRRQATALTSQGSRISRQLNYRKERAGHFRSLQRLGRGSAIALAERGANVVVARRIDVLNELVAEIERTATQRCARGSMSTRPEDIARLNETTVGRFSGTDVWSNSVEVGALWFVWKIPIEDHARLVDANLKDLLRGAHAAMKQFRAQRYRAQAGGSRA